LTSTVLLVLMVIPSAIPLLVAAHHYCWPPLKNALTTCPPTCCRSNNPDNTEYVPVDRHDPASNAHEMPATAAEQMLQKDQP
jgi:hypothetical protein